MCVETRDNGRGGGFPEIGAGEEECEVCAGGVRVGDVFQRLGGGMAAYARDEGVEGRCGGTGEGKEGEALGAGEQECFGVGAEDDEAC